MQTTEEILSQHQRDVITMGKCPYCEAPIREWKPVFGSFAPEWWETMRERGIDPRTGHKANCKHKDITIGR